MKCGDCKHAVFQRTPTGRIKLKTSGRCSQAAALKAAFTHTITPPCIHVPAPETNFIWPEYDATHCSLFSK